MVRILIVGRKKELIVPEYFSMKKFLFRSARKAVSISMFSCIMMLTIVSAGYCNNVYLSDAKGKVVKIIPKVGIDLYGFICDSNKNPIAGVVVSDGFQCVQTDAHGIYQMKRNASAMYVNYSLPADCRVNTYSAKVNTSMCYTKLTKNVKRYDFKLTKLPGGIEKDFTIIAIGDPQVSIRPSDPYYSPSGERLTGKGYSNLWRFKNETLKDIEKTIKNLKNPVYGITMGDEVDAGAYSLQDSMRTALGSTSMPIFSTIGNHDKNGKTTAYDTIGLNAYQRTWGPLNYTFNRGNVHFVIMDDIIFNNPNNLKDYTAGFSNEQVEWLRQDLKFVPKSKMIIMCYHIPLRNTSSYKNRNAILSLFKGYANVSLFCGHTHWQEVCDVTTTINAIEHIHAAACGAWWKSTLNAEGTPNGYQVYSVSDNKLTNWYYKSVGRDKNFQMRLSEADFVYGGPYAHYTYCEAASLEKNAGYVVANIFNANDRWHVMAFEGASTLGVPMKRVLTKAFDAYTLGYHAGIVNRVPSHYDSPNNHLFYYKRSDPKATVRVVAIDEFGTQYVATSFVKDFSEAMHY